MNGPIFSRLVPALWLALMTVSMRAEDAGMLSLRDDDRLVMTYNASYIASPDEDAPWYGRSGFIHPVYTPSGRIVSEGFPIDHMHQHGLMFAWTSSVYDGHQVNFWDSKKQQGRIEHAETLRADADAIEVRLRHLDTTAPTPALILNESWKITRVPHESMHVFDLVSTQSCAGDKPLEIKKYHYGAMCIRGPVSWLEGGATITTDEGKDRTAGNHSRPNWVMMYGKFDGAACGIAAMSHPRNYRAPQPVRLHPNKPYFCFAPMVLGDFQIEFGSPYVSRFRFVAFDGEPNVAALDAVWKKFADTR